MTAVSKGYKNREGRADIFFLRVCVYICIHIYIYVHCVYICIYTYICLWYPSVLVSIVNCLKAAAIPIIINFQN